MLSKSLKRGIVTMRGANLFDSLEERPTMTTRESFRELAKNRERESIRLQPLTGKIKEKAGVGAGTGFAMCSFR
jgi:hypothetical protein